LLFGFGTANDATGSMRSRIEPAPVSFAKADGYAVAHIKRNGNFSPFRSIYRSFAQHRQPISQGDIIM